MINYYLNYIRIYSTIQAIKLALTIIDINCQDTGIIKSNIDKCYYITISVKRTIYPDKYSQCVFKSWKTHIIWSFRDQVLSSQYQALNSLSDVLSTGYQVRQRNTIFVCGLIQQNQLWYLKVIKSNYILAV